MYVSVSGTEMYITGANLNIRNGLGATDGGGFTNGLGNLIVGYNENPDNGSRVGSHNVVVGHDNAYSSYGGLVAGHRNLISGPYASVSGGQGNIASGFATAVSGGFSNTASATSAAVSGGASNTASGLFATVSGGFVISESSNFGWAGGAYKTP